MARSQLMHKAMLKRTNWDADLQDDRMTGSFIRKILSSCKSASHLDLNYVSPLRIQTVLKANRIMTVTKLNN